MSEYGKTKIAYLKAENKLKNELDSDEAINIKTVDNFIITGKLFKKSIKRIKS